MDALEEVRRSIDAIDSQLLELLGQRSELVKLVAQIKKENGIEVHQPQRFDALLAKLKAEAATLNLDTEMIESIWNAIHESSKTQQATHVLSS